jgi:hypothetical protein
MHLDTHYWVWNPGRFSLHCTSVSCRRSTKEPSPLETKKLAYFDKTLFIFTKTGNLGGSYLGVCKECLVRKQCIRGETLCALLFWLCTSHWAPQIQMVELHYLGGSVWVHQGCSVKKRVQRVFPLLCTPFWVGTRTSQIQSAFGWNIIF